MVMVSGKDGDDDGHDCNPKWSVGVPGRGPIKVFTGVGIKSSRAAVLDGYIVQVELQRYVRIVARPWMWMGPCVPEAFIER